jgi:hypothetical protein
MQRESDALSKLLERLKLATNPATGFFLVGLFIYGFIGSYFGDVRSKAHPQYAASPDVKNHSLKRAIVFVSTGLDDAPAPLVVRSELRAGRQTPPTGGGESFGRRF